MHTLTESPVTLGTMGIAAERFAGQHVVQRQDNQPEGAAAPGSAMPADQASDSDSVTTYFECITACSVDDGECVTQCVEVLRDHQ
ncbi:MAG: hypothetical protein RLZZ459_1068 [Cyanobacteriota bacterium]